MQINIREVVKDDYDQIKELHKKFDLKILNESDWSKFWSQNRLFSFPNLNFQRFLSL